MSQDHLVKVEVTVAKRMSVCKVWALIFECLDLETQGRKYIFRTFKSRSNIKFMGSKSNELN